MRCFAFLAVFAVISKKRIAVSELKLDEKSFGHGLRALKCLLLLESVKAGKKSRSRRAYFRRNLQIEAKVRILGLWDCDQSISRPILVQKQLSFLI